ncbi:hypothetical protein ANN_14497 [Periplaneta americana]|uniref:Uncharacterized protein n=1 Tax=Periplaneta americana TaxID=6978 RepID=A0ABQ8SWH5_PERAM|nr:hypothetical protein ANN_14497 [Periplaneta americana]
MSPGSSTESYPAFARIGLSENPGKNLNQWESKFHNHTEEPGTIPESQICEIKLPEDNYYCELYSARFEPRSARFTVRQVNRYSTAVNSLDSIVMKVFIQGNVRRLQQSPERHGNITLTRFEERKEHLFL